MDINKLNLKTQIGYPVTFITSGEINIEGLNGFICIDFTTDTEPRVILVGTIVAAHAAGYTPRYSFGDEIQIGNKIYTLVNQGHVRWFGNGDVVLRFKQNA